MNKLLKTLGFLLLLTPALLQANPVFHRNVRMLFNHLPPPYARPQLYDAQRTYGGTIRYYIDPSLQSRTFEINGVSVRIDFRKQIEDAIAEWNAALRGALTFVEGKSDNRNVVIRMANRIEETTLMEPDGQIGLTYAKDTAYNYGQMLISLNIDNHATMYLIIHDPQP